MKNWIVYEKPDGKWDAIVDDHINSAIWVFNEGFIIKGQPSFNKKQDAIEYIKSLVPIKPRMPIKTRKSSEKPLDNIR